MNADWSDGYVVVPWFYSCGEGRSWAKDIDYALRPAFVGDVGSVFDRDRWWRRLFRKDTLRTVAVQGVRCPECHVELRISYTGGDCFALRLDPVWGGRSRGECQGHTREVWEAEFPAACPKCYMSYAVEMSWTMIHMAEPY